MIATETIVPSTKLRIKFSTKRIEVDSGTKCEAAQKVSLVDQSELSSSKKSLKADSNKRGLPGTGSIECQKEKRQKIDRKGSSHCSTVLKSLTSHRYSWVFSKPVDPVALNIPDYFTIISEPMDLGTIKSKLEKNIYSSIEEFATDVRLTFSNAMTYNPPNNDVHLMAKELSKVFEKKWKDLDKKLKCEDDLEKNRTGFIKETGVKSCNGMRSQEKDAVPKKSRVSEHKGGVQKGSSMAAKDANVSVDFCERRVKTYCNMQGLKIVSGNHEIKLILLLTLFSEVEFPKFPSLSCKVKKDLNEGNISNHEGESCPSLRLITSRCSVCGDITCSCGIRSNSSHASEISSEGSEGKDALGQDCQTKCTSPLEKKSDPDSDGPVSSLDSEHVCSSSQLATSAGDATSGEVWSTPVFSVQLSPKKALRAAMLKSRFADTILKAQQKTLLEHGDKGDPLKMQLEKERLERMQREERARIEAQIKHAEAAARLKLEEESRQRREKEREAARLAIEKMKRTVDIEHNLEIVRELEILSGCTLSYKAVAGRHGYKVAMEETLEKPQLENPLERLGLFIKDEYAADEDEVLPNGGCEEGEIL
ncbi:hypothetical protein AHAS_Ahas10G0006800 [Arachis hypogaea]|uniref:Bromo domain-containing protein n=1 Tax=Arachis hypogaea TaxID=3818 RepID=A0A445BC81_ARAHY|nr:hypothetical protein Ahy_A10g051286 isoform B [Arachis hypogaea]